jgi:3-isopropylmalate dehydratase small subunit
MSVKVYKFRKYDIDKDENIVSKRYATRACIDRLGGEIIEESERDAPDFALDSDGFYDPEE